MLVKGAMTGYLSSFVTAPFVLGIISFRILLSFCCHALSKFACSPHKYWVSESCCITPTLRVLNETITYTVNNSDNIFYYLNIFR